MSTDAKVASRYQAAREFYAQYGVDTDKAMAALARIPISLHCWQGDDVGGFETSGGLLGGGILATGNYPGKARTPDELRQDLKECYSLLPGKHRLALHAMYGDFGGKKLDHRLELKNEHFTPWVNWAKSLGVGLDFNQTFFSHPKAASGFTLAHADKAIRDYWIQHGQICRHISAYMGREQGSPCVTNLWIPDGFKDLPVDRLAPRRRLEQSLDEVFAEKLNPAHHRDSVECKLFGIGSESCVIGSHEFYMGYAVSRQMMLTLDAGHFHPTEVISDKISSLLLYVPELMLHVSRGVRWDSDHVVILSDELEAIAQEIVRSGALDRVHIGLDFFDASINRIAAWTIGARAMIKALLLALLEPTAHLRELENKGDNTARLAMLEEVKTFPVGAVWEAYCERQGVPVGPAWLAQARQYEARVLSKRS